MTSILAIDQGTTSSRAILFSPSGDILSVRQRELPLTYPHKGWVEQNPDDIWRDTLWACEEIVTKHHDKQISTIGITNQRETTIIWDRKTGRSVYNAIVWQDRRTADYCASLKEDTKQHDMVRDKTGLLLDPYFSATKIKWILDNVEGVRARAQAGDLAFGTVDCFLLWHLTGGKVHATDATNASRTMLFNIRTQQWDDDLLSLFDIPAALLPEVKDNIADFGVADIAGRHIPIGGMAGDQQAALIGQACFEAGMVKSTYGTGCFALMNIGGEFKASQHNLLTTVAYRFDGQVTYAIEGAIFVAGAAIQWLRDNLGLFDDAKQSEALALSVADNNDVYFVPAFTGLGAPYWRPGVQAAIMGLSRESNKAHITRAALEAQAYQSMDLMASFAADAHHRVESLRVDGGLVENKFVCQFLADILRCPVSVPQVIETTALGAAYLAGMQAGIYSDIAQVTQAWKQQALYTPQMGEGAARALYQKWQGAIQTLLTSSA